MGNERVRKRVHEQEARWSTGFGYNDGSMDVKWRRDGYMNVGNDRGESC